MIEKLDSIINNISGNCQIFYNFARLLFLDNAEKAEIQQLH